jgi:hypothetical protein
MCLSIRLLAAICRTIATGLEPIRRPRLQHADSDAGRDLPCYFPGMVIRVVERSAGLARFAADRDGIARRGLLPLRARLGYDPARRARDSDHGPGDAGTGSEYPVSSMTALAGG